MQVHTIRRLAIRWLASRGTRALLVLIMVALVPATGLKAGAPNATSRAAAVTDLAWQHLSSATGDLPAPSESTQQTASLILDVDKDGRNDVVIAARRTPGPSMVWYRQTAAGWTKYLIDSAVLDIEAGGAFHDIDGDGDLDILMAGDNRSNQVWWWENPYPTYAADTNWTRRLVKDSGSTKHHDQLFGDVDGDGQTELVMWNQGAKELLLADIPADPRAAEPWPLTVIYSWSSGAEHEGLALGDVDADGKLDIVGGGRWFKHTGGVDFTPTIIDDSQRFSRAAVGQLVAGGGEEVVFVSGDGIGPIRWYRFADGSWTAHDLLDVDVDHGHSLQIADVNRDGHADIFNAEMRLNGGNSDAKMRIWLGDSAGNFTLHTVASGYGNHEARLGDLDGDGDLDILGKPYNWETPRLDIWLNQLACNLIQENWPTHLIDGARPERAVFVLPADLNGDGRPDVVSGAWWYRNPGSPDGSWSRQSVGDSFNQVAAVHDFDNDGDLDLLGTVRNGQPHIGNVFVWARNNGAGGFTVLDNIDAGAGDFLQGVAVDDFNGDGLWEVALSWHQADKGIQLLTVPANPSTEQWRWSLASTTSLDEQISAGDIDRDGDPDLLLGTTWLRNDRSGGGIQWWDSQRPYRVALTATGSGSLQVDGIAQLAIDFTQLLTTVGAHGPVDVAALRLAEVDAQGRVIDAEVPFQFDPESDFEATTNAVGTLSILLTGETRAGAARAYQLYFAEIGAGLTPTVVSPRLTVVDGVQDEGQESLQITTPHAAYFFHKAGGGFSSLIDLRDDANVDWISFADDVAGAGGTFRGIPNLVRPAEGGHFHPGNTTAVTTLVSSGPLQAIIESTVGDQWTTRWDIFPTHARLTVTQAAAPYWFLYEGTPGGQLETGSDQIVRSDGSTNLAADTWAADMAGPEWVYIADPALGHSLVLAHLNDDTVVDSYRPLDDLMTVFGFGREGNTAAMTQTPNSFIVGLLDTVDNAQATAQIETLLQSPTLVVGAPERFRAATTTWAAQTLGTSSGDPDRNRLADINGDGRLDAIVGYEAISKTGKFVWYEQPANPTDLWAEYAIATDVVGPMSLDVKDMDGDGDRDVVVGEHNTANPAAARLLLFENQDGRGQEWVRHVLATGHEHHDGAQLVDIDLDGDLDVVSIGWGHDDVLLYENPSVRCAGATPPDSTPTPAPTQLPTVQPTAGPTSVATPEPAQTAIPATPTPAPPTPAPDACWPTAGDIVLNPSFEDDLAAWRWYSNGKSSLGTSTDAVHCTTAASATITTQGSNVQLYQTGLPLVPNTPYRLAFSAKSNRGHDVSVSLHQHTNGTTNYGLNNAVFDLTSDWQSYAIEFTTNGSANGNSRLRFWLAPYDANGDIYWFDNITLARLDQIAPAATATPLPAPTTAPTTAPTDEPTAEATAEPTLVPTIEPTSDPTDEPTPEPTDEPTVAPINARVTDGLLVYYPLTDAGSAAGIDIVTDQAGAGLPVDLVRQRGAAARPAGEGCGLAFTNAVQFANSTSAAKIAQSVAATNAVSIEAWLAPATLNQRGPARIVTFSQDAYNRNITLGQEGDRYVVRVRTTGTNANGMPNATTSAVVQTSPQHLVYTRTADGAERIYVNGEVVYSGTRTGNLSGWNQAYEFALGDELNGDREWLGALYAVALYDRALSSQEVGQNLQAGRCPGLEPVATATPEPVATETPTPEPAATETPTPEPAAPATPEPVATALPTPEPAATETPTETPMPEPVEAAPCAVPSDNLLTNGGLDDGESGWKRHTNGTVGLTITDGDFCGNAIRLDINRAGSQTQLYQNPIALVPGRAYRLTFAARSSTGHDIMLYLHKHSAGGSASYGIREAVFDLTEQWQSFTLDFTATDIASNDGRLRFWFPPFDQNGDVYWFDNLVLEERTD